MAAASKIEWTDHTFNPWIGCTKVSPACDHCYAEVSTPSRALGVTWGPDQPRRRTSPANWALPLRWNAQCFLQCPQCRWRGFASGPAAACPHCPSPQLSPARARVFCASLADVFDNAVPVSWRADLFDLIARTPNLDWLLLTKRIGNAEDMLQAALTELGNGTEALAPSWPWPNVWIGATISSQAEADRDIPKLLAVSAAKRFLSMEPLLGPVNLNRIHEQGTMEGGGSWDSWESCISGRRFDIWSDGETSGWPKVDWVIVGGESGHQARPMHPDWARSLRDQCAAASVPLLFKQWGEWTPGENVKRSSGVVDGATWVDGRWLPSREYLASTDGHRNDEPQVYRVGKKVAGRLLDGRMHNDFP